MILMFHITVAILGIILSALAFYSPSKIKVNLSSFCAVTTLFSGVILTVSSGANVVKVCLMGIVYFSLVAYLTYASSKKLSAQY